jgi:hypothetical protein
MNKLEVFEPAMCCSTGVCGVNVDPVLAQFSADLQSLAQAGVEVVRHNLSHDAAAFAANADVVRQMEAGMGCLPLVMVDGRIVSTGIYPSRAQLLRQLGLGSPSADKLSVQVDAGCCAPGKCC